ncbi:3-dehydroquinate dehydratase, type I [Candidatus Magnetoovum chiemensis]|nr:3-dehydroquinate dehydratase, type I [Candidatus Magnetoovum chiemensis]
MIKLRQVKKMRVLRVREVVFGEKPLIAVPFTDVAVGQLESLEGAGGVDLIELRIDMFSDRGLDSIERTFRLAAEKFLNVPMIATYRALEEGGAVQSSDGERLEAIKRIVQIADIVDIEINASISIEVLSLVRNHGKVSIGSYHNFKETPKIDDLEAVFEKARAVGFDIVKIAVMPISLVDMRTITDFTLRHGCDNVITITMGEFGKAGRVFLPLIGSLVAFGVIGMSSAPGQLSIERMREFLG